jgi:hypothetical protein
MSTANKLGSTRFDIGIHSDLPSCISSKSEDDDDVPILTCFSLAATEEVATTSVVVMDVAVVHCRNNKSIINNVR